MSDATEMREETQSGRRWEITIDSDWVTILLMVFLFAFCAFLLAWAIRDLLLDNVDHGAPRRLDAIGYVIVALYGFLFTYSFPAKIVKVAFFLMGANYTRLAIGYFYAPSIHQHSVAVIGSITQQIALAIFLFAIAQWFKLVLRRSSAVDPPGTD